MRLIDADEMLDNEAIAYMKAQNSKTISALTMQVNKAVHAKIQMLIADTPTVEAKPVVHGEWIEVEEKGLFDGEIYNATPRYKCSVCGNDAIKTEKEYRGHGECYVELTWFATDFCPNCGADMRGGKNE